MKWANSVLYTIGRTIVSPRNFMLRAINEPLKPRWIVFEVTDACNSRCKHCNIWRKKPTKDILTYKEIEKTFSDELFRDLEMIILTGGEPSLRRDLKDIILAIHKILPKTKIWLSINGLLPQRVINVVKVAVKHDISIGVGVSLDGIGEKHDLIRGVKGNFEKVDYLLNELIALRDDNRGKKDLAVGFTLSDITLHSLRETKAYAERLNVSFIVQMYDETPYYHNIGRNLVSNGLIKAVQSLPWSPSHEMWLKALMGKSIKYPCFAMYTFCVLRCNGDIVPCLHLAQESAGNVKKYPPSVIWHSTVARRARRFVKGCKGCLNDWATSWSFESYYPPILLSHVKRALRLAFHRS